MRLFTCAIAMVMACAAGVTARASEPKWVNGWAVVEQDDGSGCMLVSLFSDRKNGKETSLYVIYDARDKNINVGFSNVHATSLDEGSTKSLEVVFLGANSREYDDGWGTVDFRVSVDEGTGDRRFTSENLNREFLDDFKKYRTLGFFVDDNLVSSFALDGSAEAVEELKKCAFRVQGLNIDDPFLR